MGGEFTDPNILLTYYLGNPVIVTFPTMDYGYSISVNGICSCRPNLASLTPGGVCDQCNVGYYGDLCCSEQNCTSCDLEDGEECSSCDPGMYVTSYTCQDCDAIYCSTATTAALAAVCDCDFTISDSSV